MPSRRTLLAAGTVAGATVLAGCSSDSLTAARLAETPWPPDEATVVAAAEEFLDADHPNGAFRLRSWVYEQVDDAGTTTLYLFSDHGLVPGENQHANNGWRLSELAVEHDYVQAAPAVGRETNFVPADEGTGTVRLGRSEADTSDSVHGWRLRFGDSGDATWGAVFRTELAPDTTFTEGDLIATVRGRVRTAKSWSLREYGTEQAVELRYGEDGA